VWWSLDVYRKKDRIYMLGLQASQPPLRRHSLRWAHRSEEMRVSGRLSSKNPASSTGSQCRTGWVWKWTKYNKIGYPLHVLISPTRRFDFQTEKLANSHMLPSNLKGLWVLQMHLSVRCKPRLPVSQDYLEFRRNELTNAPYLESESWYLNVFDCICHIRRKHCHPQPNPNDKIIKPRWSDSFLCT